MMEKFSRKRLILMIGGALAFVVVVILISVILMNFKQRENVVIIDNIDECSVGISDFSKEYLFNGAYNLVNAQNNVEKKKTAKIYHALLRNGTCETESYSGDDTKTYSTKAILDIEEAGYSFRIEFNWTKNNDDNIDLGTIGMTCLDSGDLLYGTFNCEENPMALTKDELDPILGVLPYFGGQYSIGLELNKNDETKSPYIIVIEYNPPDSVYMDENIDFGAYISEKKEEALDYLKGQGIDLDDYIIKETYYVVH